MKARGWFQKLVLGLVAVLAFDIWALGLDFEKEIQKREVVSVRVAEGMKRKSSSDSTAFARLPVADQTKESSSDPFSVRLMPSRD